MNKEQASPCNAQIKSNIILLVTLKQSVLKKIKYVSLLDVSRVCLVCAHTKIFKNIQIQNRPENFLCIYHVVSKCTQCPLHGTEVMYTSDFDFFSPLNFSSAHNSYILS